MLQKWIRLSILLVCFTIFFSFTYMTVAKGEVVGETKKQITPIRIDRTNFPSLYLTHPHLEGEAIWMVQARLKELGYDVTPNGIYNPATSKAVRLFQVANGLADDGVVNREEWNTLMGMEGGSETCLTDQKAPPKGHVVIEIDVGTRTLVVYEDGKQIRKYPVAVGKAETPTPLGEWRVVHKSMNWGNGFGTRWMGLNVPWGIYGIHGTNKPYSIGTYASHGCIRMFNQDVEKLYPIIPMGTTVRIVEQGKIFSNSFKPVKMSKDSFGQNVVYVQSRLKEMGYEFDRADGRYGNMTELAVKYFQIWNGLEPTGEMNQQTYQALGLIK